MKPFVVLACLGIVGFASIAQAGVIGWLSSKARDWGYIQQTGGMRIGSVVEKSGRRVLTVEYDASGLCAITRKPTLINSGLAVRRIEATAKDGQIALRVITQVAEANGGTGSTHYADLSGIPSGSHEVFYGAAGDIEKRLGRIRIE